MIVMSRGKYQGIIGGFIALGYAIGPVLGGVLAEKISWRVSTYTLSHMIAADI
jgi:MFS family permease